MPAQVQMPPRVKRHLLTQMLAKEIDGYTITEILGDGNTAVTYGVKDEFGVPWALKVVWRPSYGTKAPFREIGRFARARDKRFLALPIAVGDWSLRAGNKRHDFVWFKSDSIPGMSLRDFLASGAYFRGDVEIQRYLENVTSALEQLEELGFSHGDLHDRNVMRCEVGSAGPCPEVRYVVIDFSEAHPVDETDTALHKDLECVGDHLRAFTDALLAREDLTRDEERTLDAVAHLPGLVNGSAAESTGVTRPLHVLERFREGLRATEQAPRKLETPFHSLSAEYIASDALLADLCIRGMSWTEALSTNSNVVLIGPRGSGKTMIFKDFRLKTKVAAGKTREIAGDPYIGFYLPCESLFYMRFSDLPQVHVEEHRDGLVLFFNMALLAEVASTLALLPQPLGPAPRGTAVALAELASEETGELWGELRLGAPVTLGELGACAERVMRYVRRTVAEGRPLSSVGSIDFVGRLVDLCRGHVPGIGQRHFVFFLDDYTEERVPLALQKALHPAVCGRSPWVCFKISAHMFGSIYSHPQPLALDEGRNIEVVNLGTAYLRRNRRKAEGKLLVRILNARFKHCVGYGGKIEEWLGPTSYPGGRTLGWALHDDTTRARAHYHGWQCLVDLCTGDYSEMIRMVGEIFQEARIRPEAPVAAIPSGVQDRAIRAVSRQFLGRVRHIRPDGQKLFEVVKAFGELSQALLRHRGPVRQGEDPRGRTRRDPYEMLTIYVDDLTKASAQAQEVWHRLQRASIFVDPGLAPSRRQVVADRVTLRRIYCPAFETTLTGSENLPVGKTKFEWFMDEPKKFCEEYFRTATGSSSDRPLIGDEQPAPAESEETPEEPRRFPGAAQPEDFSHLCPGKWAECVQALPPLLPLAEAVPEGQEFDAYIGALGFEERTTSAVEALLARNTRVGQTVLLEFDMHVQANEQRRAAYESACISLSGKPHRPVLASLTVRDNKYHERLEAVIGAVRRAIPGVPRVLLDCTSCPSVIHSQTLRVLLQQECELTLLYGEAEEYYPTREEWESGQVRPRGGRVRGPFRGFDFAARPPLLQADDVGEHPVLQVLFPTFNRERTDGVLAEVMPAARLWVFGEPHDLDRNGYRIEMAKAFAADVMYQNDPWCLLTTFDYRETMVMLGGVYAKHRPRYRVVVMPHGSKMQTLGVSLFSLAHQVSAVFATPQQYDPERYSSGCRAVWAVPLGDTTELVSRLRQHRALGTGAR